ncbi:MAG: immunoglobulin domain-containing protein [Phycisphaerae bacterium]|nr:immunoglobulin domain-containing protein [Phycisphaerae bacterium]
MKKLLLLSICVLMLSGIVVASQADWDAAVSAKSPLNWYKFDETTGVNCADSGSEGLDGEYVGVVLGQRGLFGSSSAVRFDSSAVAKHKVLFGGSDLGGQWTAEYVIKKMSHQVYTSQILCGSPRAALKLVQWNATGSLGYTKFEFWDNIYTPETVAPTSKWIHLVFRRTTDNFEVFIDGVYQAANPTGIDLPREAIGVRPSDDVDPLDAIIDEAVIYNRALTNAEIAENAATLLPDITDPVPANGADFVITDADLSWTVNNASITVADMKLYLDPNEISVNEGDASVLRTLTAVDTFDPGTMMHNTTYFWRIETVLGGITYATDTFSFTTAPPDPMVTVHPISQTVQEGQSVTLSVEAINTESYQWVKNGNDMTGETDDTLVIPVVNANVGEGVYQCRVSNAITDDLSEPATVVSARLIAKWDFEGTLDDGIEDAIVWGGVGLDPNASTNIYASEDFLNGHSGNQVLNFTESSNVFEITNADVACADYFNFYPQGLTVNCWVKGTPKGTPNGYQLPVAKIRDRNGWGIGITPGGDAFLNGIYNDVFGPTVADDTWHMVTATYEPTEDDYSIFVNGKFENSHNASALPVALNGAPVIFGAEQFSYDPDTNGLIYGAPFKGMLDEVSIYSYAVDKFDIAQMYVDNYPGAEAFCVDNTTNISADLTGDCIVDLEDFAILASEWMNDNHVYPPTE